MANPVSQLRLKIGLAFRDIHWLRRELAELHAEVRGPLASVAGLDRSHDLQELRFQLTEVRRELRELESRLVGAAPNTPDLSRMMDALQVIYDQEPENRRRLYALRESESYEAAFTDTDPLVSVVLPTYTSYATLRDRAIPSILAQTYENWELVVIGDTAPSETREVVESFDDPRIRYHNLELRGPYPEDGAKAWLVTAGPPFNAGRRIARGSWIAPFADDDALRPTALARNVSEVQAHRWELSYSQLRTVGRDGLDTTDVNEFPPRLYAAGLQGGIFHAGLTFFEHELADSIFNAPSDWSLLRRMMRAGVRIGFIDEVLCDYYPSYRGRDAASGG